MTLDEAIKEFTDRAKDNRKEQNFWVAERDENDETNPLNYADCEGLARDAETRAEYHEQLAEWLTELKEAKRLLQLAWDDIQTLNDVTVDDEGNCLIEDKFESCTECPLFCESKRYCGWRYQVDALMLIGGNEND